MTEIKSIRSIVACALLLSAVWSTQRAESQDCCSTGGIVPICKTVYETRPVTQYRVHYQTVYDEQQVTRYQPVWEVQTRMQEFTVARPVTQTVQRQEPYTVQRPVWTTEMRDYSYNQVQNVVENKVRQETVTVTRPVWENQQRQQTVRVRRYVTQTVARDVPQVSVRPVTTYRTKTIDQGSYTMQNVTVAGRTRYGLRWVPRTPTTDPVTGQPRLERGGLAWVGQQRPSRNQVRRVWQPKLVSLRIPQTTYQRSVTTTKVPTQVGRWVEQDVVRTVTVPVQRMVAEQQVRQVPYTTTRQVVQRVQRQVPIRVCKYVTEQRVRMVPVTTTRMVYERRQQQVCLPVCRMVAQQQTVRVPRVVQRLVPVTSNCCVPRTVLMSAPAPCCGQIVGSATASSAPPLVPLAEGEAYSQDRSVDQRAAEPTPRDDAEDRSAETLQRRPGEELAT